MSNYLQEQQLKQLWAPMSLSPSPALSAIRQAVLEKNPDRLPKWRFRLDSDLYVELQPRPLRPLFAGMAFVGERLPLRIFSMKEAEWKADDEHAPHRMRFTVEEGGGGWRIRPRSANWPGTKAWQKLPWSPEKDIAREKIIVRNMGIFTGMKDRLATLLGGRETISTDFMLSPHCLCCGHALKDPISMARWIGPECYSMGGAGVFIASLVEAGATLFPTKGNDLQQRYAAAQAALDGRVPMKPDHAA